LKFGLLPLVDLDRITITSRCVLDHVVVSPDSGLVEILS
jgi:hypothetical protein